METFECPGCGDPVHVEELVEGRCPICRERWAVPRDVTGPLVVDSSPGTEKRLLSTILAGELKGEGLRGSAAREAAEELLSSIQLESLSGGESVLKKFRVGCGPQLWDYLKYKRCTFCGGRHILVGSKLLVGVVEIDTARGSVTLDASVHWVCRDCVSRTPRSALGEVPLPHG